MIKFTSKKIESSPVAQKTQFMLLVSLAVSLILKSPEKIKILISPLQGLMI